MTKLIYLTTLIAFALSINVGAQELDGTCWDHLSCDGTYWIETCFSNDTMTHETNGLGFMSYYGIDATSGNLWVLDISGSCGQDTGWYSFEIIDGIMLFTSIDDPCVPREANLTCFVFMEQVVDINELDGTCWDMPSCDGTLLFETCFLNDTMTSTYEELTFYSSYGIDSLTGNFWIYDITGNCGQDTGWYSFEIMDGIMLFTSIDDPCEARETNMSCAILYEQVVGIDESDVLSEISIYPNPTQGQLTIELDGLSDVSINVYSMDGKRIYHDEKINSSTYQFYLEGGPGIYILELNYNNELQHHKLILK